MGKSFPSEQGRGAPAAESWKGCNLWGGGPLVGHPVQAPSPLQKPLRPRCAGAEGATTHTSPGSTHLAPAARLWGDPGPSGALSLRTKPGWRDAPAEGLGPAAASRRVHMWRGRRAGRGDREPGGRVYISEKFPDGRSLPALSAFPARRLGRPHRRGRSFPEKMPGAPRGPGAARSRCVVRDARPPPRAPPGAGVSRE